jgi:hypothetical protein
VTRSAISMSTAACVLLAALSASVRADLTAFWRHNPITPEAIADDPMLAGMQSWSVMAATDDGLWLSAGLRATLAPDVHFYRNLNGGSFRPSVAQQAAHPALAFHTYVTIPVQLGGLPVILGGYPDTSGQHSFGGLFDSIPGTFAVLWADAAGPSIHPPGTYEIARLTFPFGILPEIHPQSQASQVGPKQTVPIPTTVPEPAALTLATALLTLSRRAAAPTRR